MSTKTAKISCIDHYKSNTVLMRKVQKEQVTAKAIRLGKLVVMVIKDCQKWQKHAKRQKITKNCSSFIPGKDRH